MPSPSLPSALLTRLTRDFGEAAVRDMMQGFRAERPPTLRVNTLKTSDEEMMNTFRAQQIQFERIKGVPHAFRIKNRTDRELLESDLAASGMIYLQGVTSMLPPIFLDPKPGEAVLDLCAAPGSKTTQMAALMENTGTLVAYENDEVRFQKLKNTLRVQGADAVQAECRDATLAHHEGTERFDKILADVPCGAEGRINLNEHRTYRFWSEKNVREHAKLQRRLLRSAAPMLKVGGTLVYSTCTLAPEENEEMIGWLLTEFPNLKEETVTLPIASPARKRAHGVTLLPSKEQEGFFVAKLTRMS